MIAAIHYARRKKREAAAARKAPQRTAENSMDSLEDSTHETDAGERAQAGSTKLDWTDVVAPPPRKVVFWLPHQRKVFDFYASQGVQYFTAFLIVSNFIFNCAEKELDPYTDQLYQGLWRWGEFAFNTMFLIELLINFYGIAFCFWRYNWAWNTFDLIVVAIGTLTMAEAIGGNFMPPSMALIRNLRAFRIFRLFKRIKSLNKIIVSLGKAIPGVANAFVIMVIIMCIYAILGVEFYHMTGSDGTYVTYNDNVKRGLCTGQEVELGLCSLNQTVSSETARGYTYGEEYYGTFFRALYTLFQVLTGESWSEAVARPAVFESHYDSFGPVLFYVSFIIICQIVLINVVVAVLLDKMVEEEDSEGPEKQTVAEKLSEMLSQEHAQLREIFRTWDEDNSGTISIKEWRKAVKSMGYRGPIDVLDQIFASMDKDHSGELDYAEIDRMLSPTAARELRSSTHANPKRSVKEEVVAMRAEFTDHVARLETQIAALVLELQLQKKTCGAEAPAPAHSRLAHDLDGAPIELPPPAAPDHHHLEDDEDTT